MFWHQLLILMQFLRGIHLAVAHRKHCDLLLKLWALQEGHNQSPTKCVDQKTHSSTQSSIRLQYPCTWFYCLTYTHASFLLFDHLPLLNSLSGAKLQKLHLITGWVLPWTLAMAFALQDSCIGVCIVQDNASRWAKPCQKQESLPGLKLGGRSWRPSPLNSGVEDSPLYQLFLCCCTGANWPSAALAEAGLQECRGILL